MSIPAQIVERLIRMYGAQGREAVDRLQIWLAGRVPYAEPNVLAKHLNDDHLALVCDAFWQTLPFGTGGRRGRVGYGPNRMNPATLAMTVQGHCQYLREAWPDRHELAVVVANDTREFWDVGGVYTFLGTEHPLLGLSSRGLAKLACEIYTGNGIIAYLAEPGNEKALLTTPGLSFLIPRLDAGGGLNITASHNPPDDNGVKMYDHTGSQPVPPVDQRLTDIMTQATNIRTVPFAEARKRNLIRDIPTPLLDAYLDTVMACVHQLPRPASSVVFTPLGGGGLSTLGAALRRAAIPVYTPPGHGPDGTFAAIPSRLPNPENPKASQSARTFADERNIGIVLTSDPDGDRIGCEVRLLDGGWEHLTGNQIAAVLCYYLLCDLDGPRRSGGVLATLVTTRLLGAIVAHSNASRNGRNQYTGLASVSVAAHSSWIVDDLLVGFKHIAAVINALDRTGRYAHVSGQPSDIIFAAEESHGIMLTPLVKEKDAAPAGLLLASLYHRLRQQGRTLLDYYCDILDAVGGYAESSRTVMLSGVQGATARDRLMHSLRSEPPLHLVGLPVTRVLDYWDTQQFGPLLGDTDRRMRNLLCYSMATGAVIVRPSGTEPTLKLYCHVKPPVGDADLRGLTYFRHVQYAAERVADRVYDEIVSRLAGLNEAPSISDSTD